MQNDDSSSLFEDKTKYPIPLGVAIVFKRFKVKVDVLFV